MVRPVRRAVVVCRVHPTTWTEPGAWWQVGVRPLSGHAELEAHRARQLRCLSR
jgi:3D-(3,5/4)-trihydroxycyclohexane-1,2-dione acylhydrolase (decyclizing)